MENKTSEIESAPLSPLEQVEIRPLKIEDMPFVFATWLKSYKNSRFAKRIKHDVFFMWHHILIEQLIARPSNRSYVAHLKNEPDVIFGYLISEMLNARPQILHYCFIKESFRRNGIARMLYAAAGLEPSVIITHWTFLADPIIEKHQSKITYDPYRA